MESLDDLRLFVAVADAGGLSAAARATGQAVPTLSRRMAALERELGQRLFERGPRGYSLTSAGRDLLAEAGPVRDLSARLTRFRQQQRAPEVRITAGRWTTRFLARNLAQIWQPDSPWRPALMASNATVDIARREADIGIRNRRPDQSWLAGRRLALLDYAEFALSPEVTGYVTLPQGAATTPSERWLRSEHPEHIVATASDARTAADMARAGLGRVILPLFAGHDMPGLRQVSPPIAALRHEEWLICHHDARHDPPVRAALEAIATLLSDPAQRPTHAPQEGK